MGKAGGSLCFPDLQLTGFIDTSRILFHDAEEKQEKPGIRNEL